jgi:hypothetical protein
MDKKILDALETARASRNGFTAEEVKFIKDALADGRYDARDINRAGRTLGYFAGKSYDSVGNKIRRIQQEAKS